MRVLVTGASGFIGAHLCERLRAAGHAVRALVRRTSDTASLRDLEVEYVYGDLTDPDSLLPAVEGAEWVFHCAAALRGFREADLLRVNAAGTENVVEACGRARRSLVRLVYVSSLAAAGPSPNGETPLTERMKARPVSWYGRSKYQGELAVLARKDLPSVILRPPVVFGPRERDLLTCFKLARRGLLPLPGSSRRYLSLVYVKDLVEGLVTAAQADAPPGETYFLSGAEIVSYRALAEMIAVALGVRTLCFRLPELAAVLAASVNDLTGRLRGKPARLSAQKVVEMRQPGWICSPEKAARELGWSARTPLPEALAATAKWYREHGWL